MNVSFAITLDYLRFYDEGALAALPPETLALLKGRPALEGMLVISPDAGDAVKIVDELEPWVQNLCFDAVARLCRGESVTVSYFSRAGLLTLTPQGDSVSLSGDLTPAARLPAAALLPQLYACGRRFIAFARSVKGDDEDYMANLDYVSGFEEPARRALSDANLLRP